MDITLPARANTIRVATRVAEPALGWCGIERVKESSSINPQALMQSMRPENESAAPDRRVAGALEGGKAGYSPEQAHSQMQGGGGDGVGDSTVSVCVEISRATGASNFIMPRDGAS